MGRVNVKTKNQERLEKLMLFGFLLLAIITTIGCCYGYAAFESDLQVSGEGTIKPQVNFTSTYMQDVTPTECANVDTGQTKQLIDKRDGKSYWVAKLKDGNCWMVQDLALDLSTKKTLTPNDTNVLKNYTPMSNTNDIKYAGTRWPEQKNEEYSWSEGPVVLATPLLTETCINHGGKFSAIESENVGDVCAKTGFVNVSNQSKFKPGFKARMGNWEGANATNNTLVALECTIWTGSGVAKKCVAGNYDEHYLIGNYYQESAALAGTNGLASSGEEAPSSICPKGWRLPLGGSTGGEFGRLLTTYGYVGVGDTRSLPLKHTIGEDELTAEPFYMVRSGYINLGNGYLRSVGDTGVYWASTVNDVDSAYYLSFTGTDVYPALTSTWWHGFAVRCVVK